jgi:hypothetical protein
MDSRRRAIFRDMPKHPSHIRIQPAKAFVDDSGRMVLIECESCGQEKYLAERQTVCEECRSKRRPKKSQARLASLSKTEFENSENPARNGKHYETRGEVVSFRDGEVREIQ